MDDFSGRTSSHDSRGTEIRQRSNRAGLLRGDNVHVAVDGRTVL
jgi:hypothetical protein